MNLSNWESLSRLLAQQPLYELPRCNDGNRLVFVKIQRVMVAANDQLDVSRQSAFENAVVVWILGHGVDRDLGRDSSFNAPYNRQDGDEHRVALTVNA